MLLTKQNVIKLADLGIAKLIESTNGKTWAGTENYMSPEIFKLQFENIYYYPNTDIW
jgi:serine/threonine protein kinase